MTVRACLTAALLLVVACPAAMASHDSWVFQDTKFTRPSSGLALAMRQEAWPVVFTNDAVSLYPTGWKKTGTNVLTGTRTLAVTSPDGDVAAFGNGFAVVSGPSSWQTFPAAAVNFDSQGRLYKAVGDVISYSEPGIWRSLPAMGFGSPGPSDYIAFAVNSIGEVGAVTTTGGFFYQHYSAYTGGWTKLDLNLTGTTGPPSGTVSSMVFDGQDRPHFIMRQSTVGPYVADYDVRTNAWSYYPFTVPGPSDTMYTLAFDGKDTIGTAYTYGGMLHLLEKTGLGPWMDMTLPASPYGSVDAGSVGFAYDYNGMPVIAFSAGGKLAIAYDPPAVPEPASMGLLILAGGMILRRRRSA